MPRHLARKRVSAVPSFYCLYVLEVICHLEGDVPDAHV